ncbi:hypothetical protein SDC9_70924 [bioreactor metagenome]|uniref:NAD-specific glutamate dehydrogenase n=1 Tax=bioreactor metagenome TaxID=1076179 RepID=A0A644Y767_9ZZZZ
MREVVGVGGLHVRGRDVAAQHFAHDGVQQQAGGGVGVAGVFLDLGAGGQDGGLVDLFHGHAVIQVAHGLGDDGRGRHAVADVGTGRFDQRVQAQHVKLDALAVFHHVHGGHLGQQLFAALCALLRAALAVQHIGARHFLMAAAHQAELDLVLHIFDVEGAAARARAGECVHDRLREVVHHFADAGRRRALRTMRGQKRFHHGHGDLLRLERNHGTVAADDLELDEISRGRRRRVGGRSCGFCERRAHLVGWGMYSLHVFLLWCVRWRPGRRATVAGGFESEAARYAVAHYIWCV